MATVDFLWQMADHLQSHGVGQASGSNPNIFVSVYPDDPDNIIAFMGRPGGEVPNKYIGEFHYPRFQVLVRNADYQTAAAKMREIRELLHDQLAVELVNFYVLRIQADQDAYPLGQDERGRFEFTINFTAQYRFRDSGADSHP